MPLASDTTQRLRAAFLAAIVAGMVWVFAEGESVSSRTVSATLTFPPQPGSDLIFRPDPSFRGRVQVRLEGSTRTIDAVAAAVGGGGGDIALVPGMPGVPDKAGVQSVDVQKAISSLPRIRELRGTIAHVDPQLVVVDVIRLASRDVPVRVELGSPVQLEGPPVPSPVTVTLRFPASEADRVPETAAAVAYVSEQDLRRIRPDGAGSEGRSVPAIVRPPDELGGMDAVLVSPEQLTVTLRPRRKTETLTLAAVPVWVSLPASEDATRWVIQVQDFDRQVTDVQLSGPIEEIERIRNGAAAVRAVVELSKSDLEKGLTSKRAEFSGLPPGVSASAASRIVRFQVHKRAAPSP